MSGTFSPGAKSTTAENEKNFWATQWHCFHDAQGLYGRIFRHDVAAMQQTSKVPGCYYGPDHQVEQYRDALKGSLIWPDDWWCNPPFDQKIEFITKALEQQAAGRQGMMLIPYEPCSGWWQDLLSTGVIIYEPRGRYNFYEPDGQTPKSGVNFPIAFVAFPAMRIGASIRVQFQKSPAPRLPRKRVKKVVDTE